MEELWDLGFETGVKLQKEREWVKTQIYYITDGTQNITRAREIAFKCASTAGMEVPKIFSESDEALSGRWADILCYFSALNNGTLHK